MWNDYTTADGWRVTVAATNDEAYAVLQQDRVVNCFALADLLPPFRQHTRISLAAHEQTGQQATLLVVEHPDVYVLATSGHAAGVAALLAHLGLPAYPLLQALPEHWPLLAARILSRCPMASPSWATSSRTRTGAGAAMPRRSPPRWLRICWRKAARM